MTEYKTIWRMKKMRDLQSIQADINMMDQAIQGGGSINNIESWASEKEKYEREYGDATAYWEAQQERVQAQEAQTEQIGGLKEIMQSIFEATFPKEETIKLIGLTEYEATQQTYNQLVDQAVDENQTSLYEAFQQQLEQRDERYRLLTIQGLETQRQLDIANEDKTEFINLNKELADQVEMQQYTIQTLEQNVENKENEIEQMEQEVQRLNSVIFDLQKQIANVQVVPQTIDYTPVAASESLSDRIAKAKVNSKLQLANVKTIGANWVEGINSEGNKEVAHVNDVEPVYEFPSVNPVSEEEATTKEIPFREEEEIHSAEPGLADQSLSLPGEEENEVITLESLKAEFNSLRRDCKQNNNIQQYIENDMDKFKGWAAKVEQILIDMGQWKNDDPLTPYGLSLNNEAVA